jgi:hypothetical protein
MTMNARVTGDPLAFGNVAEKAIHELNSDIVVFDITTLDLRQQIATIGLRIGGTFVGAFGLLALVLAAVGMRSHFRPSLRCSASWLWGRASCPRGARCA